MKIFSGDGRDALSIQHQPFPQRKDAPAGFPILRPKLRIFAEELERREAVAARYREALADAVVVPTVPDGVRSAWAQFTIRVADRAQVASALADRGIPTAVYYPLPLHRQGAYGRFPVGAGGMAATDHAATEVLSLPMHPYLDPADQDLIVDALRLVVGAAS